MDLGLQGKVAIVTGSSDGIGYATAHALAREGVRVVLCARREPLLAEARATIARETGAELLAVPCDVQQLPDVQRLTTETMQRFGAIQILVNNAGSVPSKQFTDVDDAMWHQILEAKLLNYIRVTREVVPYIQKAGWGRIISIAGTAGWQPSVTMMANGLSNAAVINWTKSMSPIRGRRHFGDKCCAQLDCNATPSSWSAAGSRQKGSQGRRSIENTCARYPASAPWPPRRDCRRRGFSGVRAIELHDRDLRDSRWRRHARDMTANQRLEIDALGIAQLSLGVEYDMNAMRFRAKYVSASENGDYYQVAFENTDPAGDAADVDGPDIPYLLIQRQFEDPDGGRCYIETHDEGYIGHFRLRSIEFSPSRLLLEIARDRNNKIEVIFNIRQSEFEEVQRVIDIISGKSSPDDEDVL